MSKHCNWLFLAHLLRWIHPSTIFRVPVLSLMGQTMSFGLLASKVFYRFMAVSLFSQTTLPHLGILVVQRDWSRIKPSRHGFSNWWFLRLVSLYSSLHRPKLYRINGLPCVAMRLNFPNGWGIWAIVQGQAIRASPLRLLCQHSWTS